MNDKNTLIIFTAEFPYGQNETFLENELPIIAKQFNTIKLFPYSIAGSITRSYTLPSNVSVIDTFRIDENSRVNSFEAIKIFQKEFVNQSLSNKLTLIKKWKYFITIIKKAVGLADGLEKVLKSQLEGGCYLYSFWLNEWAFALSILKSRGYIDNYISRCAGFDIWDERYPDNYLPFRYFMYSKISRLYVNNYLGMQYCQKFNFFSEKVKCAYWGTTKVEAIKNAEMTNEVFVIVSCSHLVPLKRVDLIADALQYLGFEFHWHHFGDGPLMKQLSKTIKQSDSENVTLYGTVNNEDVLSFYSNNKVDVFVTCSETEGMPVSIQEALSFGIPILATPVGGIPEMVLPSTGKLLDKNPTPISVAEGIADIKKGLTEKSLNRKLIKKFWSENFDSEIVYTDFARKIKKHAFNQSKK